MTHSYFRQAFDSNAMRELAHIKADHYQRNGGGGAFKVYATSKAYYDARGHNELSAWDRLVTETKIRFRQSCETAKSHYKFDCLTSKGGFYDGDSIPF
jgi:hypothetical protein